MKNKNNEIDEKTVKDYGGFLLGEMIKSFKKDELHKKNQEKK